MCPIRAQSVPTPYPRATRAQAPPQTKAVIDAKQIQLALLDPVEIALGPLLASRCRVGGDGIARALLGHPTEFLIEACDELGRRQPQSLPATFHVAIRSTGTRARARVIDQGDGSYRVLYKPTATGRFTIAISTLGEPLPGSPYLCVVQAPTAHAAQCEVLTPGEAWTIAACDNEHLRVVFRDIIGTRLRTPVEMDLYAQRARSGGLGGLSGSAPAGGSGALNLGPPVAANAVQVVGEGDADGGGGGSGGGSGEGGSSGEGGEQSASGGSGGGGEGGSGGSGEGGEGGESDATTVVEQPPSTSTLMSAAHFTPATRMGHGGTYLTRSGFRVPLPAPLIGPDGRQVAGMKGALEFLRSLDEFETLVVGSKGLKVTEAKPADSATIGVLPPGHALDFFRVELVAPSQDEHAHALALASPPSSPNGNTALTDTDAAPPPSAPLQLRACIMHDGTQQESWRGIYPSEAYCSSWRTPSWRELSEEQTDQMQLDELDFETVSETPSDRSHAHSHAHSQPHSHAHSHGNAPREREATGGAATTSKPPGMPRGSQPPQPARGRSLQLAERSAQLASRSAQPARDRSPQPSNRSPQLSLRSQQLTSDRSSQLSHRAQLSQRSQQLSHRAQLSQRSRKKVKRAGGGVPTASAPASALTTELFTVDEGDEIEPLAEGAASAGGAAVAGGAAMASEAAATGEATSADGGDRRGAVAKKAVELPAVDAKGSGKRTGAPKRGVGGKKGSQKQTSARELAQLEAAAKAAEEEAARELADQTQSATMLQAGQRRVAARRRVWQMKEERDAAQAAAAAASAAALQASLMADRHQSRTLARSAAAAREKVGRLQLKQNPSFGWVTLWVEGDSELLMAKQMGPLPAHIRRQHIENWSRRCAGDPSRELERARMRDAQLEAGAAAAEMHADSARRDVKMSRTKLAMRETEQRAQNYMNVPPRPAMLQTSSPTWLQERRRVMAQVGRSPAANSPPAVQERARWPSQLSAHLSPPRRFSPSAVSAAGGSSPLLSQFVPSDRTALRSAHLEDIDGDPLGAGFAYGGVTGGRGADADGTQPVDHLVHFSIGRPGHYLLHVRLRTGAALPGSPFALTVRSGVPHPLSTFLPAEAQPLHGYLKLEGGDRKRDRKSSPESAAASCTLRLLLRDKMGNLCDSGSAAVTCGCMGRDGELVESEVTDRGDGSYDLRWYVPQARAYQAYVKLDGLHVIGSPTTMQVYRDHATYIRNDPVARAAMEAEAKALQRVMQLAEAVVSIADTSAIEAVLQDAITMAQEELDAEKFKSFQREAAEQRAAAQVRRVTRTWTVPELYMQNVCAMRMRHAVLTCGLDSDLVCCVLLADDVQSQAVQVEEAAKKVLREAEAKARAQAKVKQKSDKEAKKKG